MLRATWSSLAAVIVLDMLAAVAGCRDGPTSVAPQNTPGSEPELSVYAISCLGDVSNLGLACAAATPTDPRPGVFLAGGETILGGQRIYVELRDTLVSYDGQVFQADVQLVNLIGQKLGTRDGTTVASQGIRIFYHTGPTVTAGSGTVEVSNADGDSIFTNSHQFYYQYNEILAPGDTSQWKTWTWDVEATVDTFKFSVYVWAPIQYENGWVDVSPADPEVGIDTTETLSAVVRNRLGQEVSGRTVTWSSSEPSICDVDPGTGEVTGVAEGTCTVCASSSGLEADGCVTVTVKPVVYVRTLADPESPTVGGTSGITLQLDVTQIPEPVPNVRGDVTWDDPSLLKYLDDASGPAIWDFVVANEDPLGTLNFIAVSIEGVSEDVPTVLTFTVEGQAVGCTQFVPTLTELDAIDPVTSEPIDLLQRAIIITESVNVCVVAP